jgi:hypothetical protein
MADARLERRPEAPEPGARGEAKDQHREPSRDL